MLYGQINAHTQFCRVVINVHEILQLNFNQHMYSVFGRWWVVHEFFLSMKTWKCDCLRKDKHENLIERASFTQNHTLLMAYGESALSGSTKYFTLHSNKRVQTSTHIFTNSSFHLLMGDNIGEHFINNSVIINFTFQWFKYLIKHIYYYNIMCKNQSLYMHYYI